MKKYIQTILMAILILLLVNAVALAGDTTKKLVYFRSDTCSYCGEQDKILNSLAEDLKSLKVHLEKVNVKTNKAKAVEYGYKNQRLPYFLVLDGKEVIAEGQGVHLKNDLLNLLEDQEGTKIIFEGNQSFYTKNNHKINMSNKAFLENGEVYIPVRDLANALGVPISNVKYESGIVSIVKGNTLVEFMVGAKAIRIQDDFFDIPSAPKMIDDVVYIPAQYLADALGYETQITGTKAVITNKPAKITSTAGVDPEKHIINGEVYYDFEEMLNLGGVNEFEYFFEKENLLILSDDFRYKAILLNEENISIYLIDRSGNYYKYELDNQMLYLNGKWLVRGDNDAVRIGMLATLIR